MFYNKNWYTSTSLTFEAVSLQRSVVGREPARGLGGAVLDEVTQQARRHRRVPLDHCPVRVDQQHTGGAGGGRGCKGVGGGRCRCGMLLFDQSIYWAGRPFSTCL